MEVAHQGFMELLSQNQIEMITLCENKGSSHPSKYRALIETIDGKTFHMDLPAVENFLYKLD